MQDVLCSVRLGAQRVERGGGRPHASQWNQCEGADSPAQNRRWTEDSRTDHSSQLCVSVNQQAVNVRPVPAARCAGAAETAAAPSPKSQSCTQHIVQGGPVPSPTPLESMSQSEGI